MKFASICVLAYKRPQALIECLDSLRSTTDYPYELIVNLDGGDDFTRHYLQDQLGQGKISKLILNGGNNRGVGRSFQNCLAVAEGDYIFKVDADLTFEPNWLSTAIEVLDTHSGVGAVSLFDYNHYDPNDNRFKPSECHLEHSGNCIIVNDFVSSIYGFREKHSKDSIVLGMPDDGFHQWLKEVVGHLAITEKDYVKNNGFGRKSVYVTMPDDNPEHAFKTKTYAQPLIFLSGLQEEVHP